MSRDVVPDFSVAICTYNGALRLPGLLERVRSQQASCRWEVVIVDNNSDDCTATVVQEICANWRSDVPLRYYFEPRQGIAFARRCAVRETNSPLIGFLDDDTLPDDNWVHEALLFGRQHPEAGAYGSSIRGVYETPPPPDFYRIACCLAIIDRGETPFQYSSQRGVLPAGAGMVVRRQAWLEQVPESPALAGVSAGSLNAKGEDVETLSYIRRSWAIWHNPAQQIGHIIPQARLERDYLFNLFWQIGLSRYPLRRLQYQRWQWPVMLLLYSVNDFRKGIGHLCSVRFWGRFRKNVLREMKKVNAREDFYTMIDRALQASFSTVEACEFVLLLGSFLSPFYASRHRQPPLASNPASDVADVSVDCSATPTRPTAGLSAMPIK